MSDREDDPGVAAGEDRGLSRAAHAAQDNMSELTDPEVADEDEQTEDDMFELALTLDDPHQPGKE